MDVVRERTLDSRRATKDHASNLESWGRRPTRRHVNEGLMLLALQLPTFIDPSTTLRMNNFLGRYVAPLFLLCSNSRNPYSGCIRVHNELLMFSD